MSDVRRHGARVARFDELEDGRAVRVELDGAPVCLVRIGDTAYAVGDVCSHAEVSLSTGDVWCEERQVECPRHGSVFSLETGEAESLPATQPVPVYPVTVVDGWVWLG